MPENSKTKPQIIQGQAVWKNLHIYQKADVAYQLTFAFCDRFIHLYKDRTRDQMIQAARSCKQNIVEGLADGITSTEMQLKLLNVARASLQELKEDFTDYIKSRHLTLYTAKSPAYTPMLQYCRSHNKLEDYQPYFTTWTDEQMCNYAITICHIIDKMMMTFLKKLEEEFVTEGGIKERMHRARTGYRQQQDARLRQLENEELPRLRQQLAEAQQQAQHCRAQYLDLKSRALKAYYQQQQEIAELKKRLEGRG